MKFSTAVEAWLAELEVLFENLDSLLMVCFS